MNRQPLIFSFVAIIAIVSAPAFAWGPVARQAIVTTAMRVISKDGPVQLNKLEKDLEEGVTAPADVVAKLIPGLKSSPVRAIESEMNLLASVKGNAVEPYLAYRLGVLGAAVADLTSPLARDNSPNKARYFADVDANFSQVRLVASDRKIVDAVPYFERLQRTASIRKEMILREYQEGTGFNEVAKAALSEDASLSVDAVADVWYTILTGNVVHARVSDAQMREYVIGSMEYCIKHRQERDIDATYKRLTEIVTKTPDLAKRIGDMLYDAGLYERAMDEYRFVLAAEPNRKDVIEKMADYYMKEGDDDLQAKRLQQALDAYTKAAKTNPLHSDAEAKRLKVEGMIAERDARLEAIRHQIEDAGKAQTEAEQLALQKRPADAITALKQAQQLYEAVNDEFPVEYQAAQAGLANISGRLRELKTELIQNAQNLSGSGASFDAKKLAENAKTLDEQALQSLQMRQLAEQIDKAKAKYLPTLEIK